MQEPSIILAIAAAAILVATGLVVFAVRKRQSRRDKMITVCQEINSSSPTAETTTGIPRPNQLASLPTLSEAKPILTPEDPQNEKDASTPNTNPGTAPPDTLRSTLIEQEQESTIRNREPETSEVLITDLTKITESASEDDIQIVQETGSILTDIEAPSVDEPVPPKNRRKLSPEERGGGRRGQRTKEPQETTPEKTQRARRPEFVCWQQSRKWFLGIEMSDDYGDASQLKVSQGDDALITEGNSRWSLSTMYGNVSICFSRTSERFDLPVAEQDKPFLMFKLSGQHHKSGRRIRYATSGAYLLVVPENWIRNEELSGIAQVTPVRCHIAGFQAHLFHLNPAEDGRIAFLTPEKEEIEIPNRKSQFDLVGLKVPDASDEVGPLFGLSPPSIRSRDIAIWNNVETIVIGEEGERRGGWRASFKPDADARSVDLTPYFSDKDGGWFFVRIYDGAEGPPIESLDFRFFKNLQAINVGQHNPLPGKTGHKAVTISIGWNNHGPCELFPYQPRFLSTRVDATSTTVEIPPQPDFDRTEWTLVARSKSKIQIALIVERVWWTLCKTNTAPEIAEWQDKPISLSRQHCTATSEHLLRIRFPKRRWTSEVRVGFQQGRAMIYRVEVTEQVVDIPLNHFEGVNQLEDVSKDHPLILWLDGFPEQTVAILSLRSEVQRGVKHRHDIPIRLNVRRLLKYLRRLEHATRDASLSEMLDGCKKNWSSPDVRARREVYLIQTACVITVSWRVMKTKGRKPIGRRKGWIRTLIKFAEMNPSSLSTAIKKYETLAQNTSNRPLDQIEAEE